MRAFVAVLLSEELRKKVSKLQERIDMLDIESKLVEAENLHYNLKFLGEINDEDIAKVKAVMDRIIPTFPAFDIHITGVGAFPRATYARVVWAGAREGAQQLTAMAEAIELALGNMGFRREERPFTPHLTLARIRSGQQKTELITLLKELENTDIGIMRVEEVILFQSRLTPKGPIYMPVHTVKLGGAGV